MGRTERFWKYRNRILSSKFGPEKKYYQLRTKIILTFFCADISITPYIHQFETPHGFSGIFISGASSIGEGCTILQNVTIGSNKKLNSKHPGAPQIGNNVYIGAGAVIIGGIYIGDNVYIGANTTVFESVASNCTVVSQAPRVIPSNKQIVENGDTKPYLTAWNKTK